MELQKPGVPRRPNKRTPNGRVGPSTSIVGAIAALFIIVGVFTGGFGGALVMAGIVALLTGLYVLLTGRPSWLRLPGRKFGLITLAGSVVITLAGGALLPPVEEPATNASSGTSEAQESTSAAHIPAPTATPELKTDSPKPTRKPSPGPKPAKTAGPLGDEPAKQEEPDNAQVLPGTALAQLATVDIKGRAPKTGYDRDLFGYGWMDPDGNGCDGRNDILKRELINETFEPGTNGCIVLTGTLADPFTATIINFVRGNDTSNDVQIDHVVALSDAWQKGAPQLAPNQREAFANDPLNLLAVDGPTNASKGDSDAATWLPPNRAFWCEYVALQTAVKAKYDLWMTSAEHGAIARILTTRCPDQPVPADNGGVAVPIAAEPAPVVEEGAAPERAPSLPAAPGDVYYDNCTAAHEAGAAPVYRGDPGYGTHLDGDGDGSGCE